MVDAHGAKATSGGNPVKKKPLRYFYLNGNLHKKLQINRGADQIVTWCYPLHKRVAYTYSDLKKRMKPAFRTEEVAKMLLRTRKTIEWAILDGNIPEPQHVYGMSEIKRKHLYMWSEEDVLTAHAWFSSVHRGRPRKDGLVTPQKIPSASEVRAMMRNQEVLYVKVGDEFKPVWDAENFD